MDTASFIAAIVGALAWPAAVFGILLLLRRPIIQLIPTIQRLKYKELAVEFGRRVEEAAVEAGDSLPPPKQIPTAVRQPRLSHLLTLARTSPRAAVLESWLDVESAAVELAHGLKLQLGNVPVRSPTQALRAIEKSGYLNEAIIATLKDLRALRNEAVHYPEFAIDEASAMTYVNTAAALAGLLREKSGSA